MVGIILKYHAAIAWTDYDLGCVTHYSHEIHLLPDSVGVRQPSRQHLYSQRYADIIEAKTRPFIDMGIWIPCPFSDWCAQLVVAAKNRVCHDFTDLNRVTVKDAYPITLMSDIFSKMSGKGLFSMWDADRGFCQIMMTGAAMRKAAFEYKKRHYMSQRMLFGLTGAPATFNRNNEPTIRETKERLSTEAADQDIDNYFDDNIISGPENSWLGHLKATVAFLEVAISHGWKYKAAKVRIGYFEIKLLGVIVSAKGKRADPDKIETLLSMRTPENYAEVKSFVGLAHWFQEHCKGMAWNITILNKLSVAGSEFLWTAAAEEQFQWIKRQMKSLAVLALWSAIKTSCLYTDSSGQGMGCFLTQLDKDGKTEVVIAFGSIALTPTQIKYHITRLEALAFIWSLGHFHAYLCARPFLWKTDHRALKYIFDASKSSVPVLARYKLIADEYKFSPIWISGSAMIADVFSRLCIIPADKRSAMTNREMVMADYNLFEVADIESRRRARYNSVDFLLADTSGIVSDDDNIPATDDDPTDETLLDFNRDNQQIHEDEESLRGKLAIDVPSFSASDLRTIQVCGSVRKYLADGTIDRDENRAFRRSVVKMAKSCFLKDDVLYKKRKGILREIADTYAARKQALQYAHDGAGHRGVEGTLVILASRFWFPLMEKFVCRHIAQCDICQRHARAGPVHWFPNYAVAVLDIFAHWGIDFAGPFPIDQFGFQYVCIAVDSLTRWPEIRPSKTATAADAANFIYHDIVCRFGLPKSIQSDNGPHFANEVIDRLTQILEIRHRFSTPYYPQSNGRAERLIGTLKSMMIKSVQDTDRDEKTGVVNWQPAIYSALYVYRSSPHHATGVSPAYLVYGENIALPFLHSHQPPPTPRDQVSHKKQILDRLAYLREAIPGLRGAHHQFARTKEGRKVLVRPAKYNVGDEVLLLNSGGKVLGYGSAFVSNWIGPYKIHAILDKGAYKLSTIPKDGKRVGVLKNPVNWSRLRKYVPQGDDEFFDPNVNVSSDMD